MQRRRRQDRVDAYEEPAYLSLLARISDNLKALRTARNISQEEAAWACHLSWGVYQRAESGRGNLTTITLAKLASGFDVDPSELLALPKKTKHHRRAKKE